MTRRHERAMDDDWFSDWVRTLAEQRLANHTSEEAAEMHALAIVRSEFLPRIAQGRVTSRSAMLAWRDSLVTLLQATPDGKTMFFATRLVHWIGGLVLGCCSAYDAWLATRPAVLFESETASQLTRIHCRNAAHREKDAEERNAYARFLTRMGYSALDVAAIAKVTEGLIDETEPPSMESIVACDRVWHFLGGYHEGAWMTSGLIRTAPRERSSQ